MAKVQINDLAAAAALDGTELVELEQDGGSVQCTMQAIADFAAGPIENKTLDFTADGASGTIYTNVGAVGTVDATLEDSPVGTRYTFVKATADGYGLRVYADAANTIAWHDYTTDVARVVPGDGDWVEGQSAYDSFTILKVSATHWVVIAGNPRAND